MVNMINYYIYVPVFIIVGILFVFVTLLLSHLLTPSKPDPMKQMIYECGEVPIGATWIQFNIRFYIIALAFIIFDVETVLILPAIVSYNAAVKNLGGATAFIEIAIFVGILLLGLAYLWAKGDLEWIKRIEKKSEPWE